MKRVATGDLPRRLRNSVTRQLTENPERMPLGVLSLPSQPGNELRAAVGDTARPKGWVAARLVRDRPAVALERRREDVRERRVDGVWETHGQAADPRFTPIILSDPVPLELLVNAGVVAK